ncbi:MAG TPA: multicopper oxidase domain-containing protein [Nitrososphaeraceae archaeon]|nr:multicopper oxidase domain-containing protein [Nitrososphaeraceae archaeon]
MKILQRSLSLLLSELIVLLVILSLFNNNYILETALSALKYDTSIIGEKQEEPSIATKNFTLLAQERIIQISPDNELHPGGIFYKAMTFNGSIPAPAISVNQGDTFEITLENKDTIAHSLNLHGIEGQNQSLLAYVEPGDSKTLRATANNFGVFMYHCTGDNLNGIWEHVASGMYGAIIVHPKNEKPAKEFYMVFGEIYNTADKGLFSGTNRNPNAISNSNATNNTALERKSSNTEAGEIQQQEIGSFDMSKFIANKPDLILTNGKAYKYIPFIGTQTKMILNNNAEVFKVKPGELTRWYIVNAGPRGHLSFNIVGGMLTTDPNLHNFNSTSQMSKTYMISIPPGSAESIEVIFPEEGVYVGNDHDIGRLLSGAIFAIIADNNSTSSDHPAGTHI